MNALSFLLGPGMAVTLFCIAFANLNIGMVSVPKDQECLQAVGYCPTLSCTIANINMYGFVFLILFFALWVSSIGSMMPVMDISDFNTVDPGTMSPKHFFIYTVLVRVGIAATLFTGVSPSFMTGSPKDMMGGISVTNTQHGIGVFAGLILMSSGVLLYCHEIVRLKAARGHSIWGNLPHMVVGFSTSLACFFFICFVICQIQNTVEGPVADIYWNSCIVRDPSIGCQVPPGFNMTEHLKFYGLDKPGFLDKTIPLIKNGLTRQCFLHPATGKCYTPDCNFDRFAGQYSLECFPLFVAAIAAQGFVSLMQFDAEFLPGMDANDNDKRSSLKALPPPIGSTAVEDELNKAY